MPRATPASILKAVTHLGYLQLDPTNVVARNHLLVLWSRFGSFRLDDFDRLMWRDHSLYETLSYVLPTADRAMHLVRARAAARGEFPMHVRMNAWMGRNARLRRHVLGRLRREGPLPVTAFEDRAIDSWTSSGWTSDRNVSQMLSFLMRLGDVTIGARASGRRVFTLARTWLPKVRPLTRRQAALVATERALRAMGIATLQQLRRYYALGYFVTADALRHLERSGAARRITVEGLSGDHFVAGGPEGDGERTTLLSPFDSLIIDRTRTEALFGMRYRMEIYVPKHLRKRGFWAMPILHRDQLIGTVDPRVDRERGVMEVVTFHLEVGAPRERATRRAVEAAVEDLATFAGARDVVWPRGIASSYSSR